LSLAFRHRLPVHLFFFFWKARRTAFFPWALLLNEPDCFFSTCSTGLGFVAFSVLFLFFRPVSSLFPPFFLHFGEDHFLFGFSAFPLDGVGLL